MKLLLLVGVILAALLFGLGQARPSEADSPEPDANELDTGNGEEAVTKARGTVSIKVRHVLTDPLLCEQLSRYHPHHPQCHGYCKRQGHWIVFPRSSSATSRTRCLV
ncbi:hypothetical protein KR200_004927 [Drosophila serrata]|nr:hypothetical protein KR200_004927 [Drosophila serrata]